MHNIDWTESHKPMRWKADDIGKTMLLTCDSNKNWVASYLYSLCPWQNLLTSFLLELIRASSCPHLMTKYFYLQVSWHLYRALDLGNVHLPATVLRWNLASISSLDGSEMLLEWQISIHAQDLTAGFLHNTAVIRSIDLALHSSV